MAANTGHAAPDDFWLASLQEEVLEPELPIIPVDAAGLAPRVGDDLRIAARRVDADAGVAAQQAARPPDLRKRLVHSGRRAVLPLLLPVVCVRAARESATGAGPAKHVAGESTITHTFRP